MAYTDIIPLDWVKNKNTDRFKMWVRELPINDRTKKEIIVEYCDMAGVDLTTEFIRECGVEPGTI